MAKFRDVEFEALGLFIREVIKDPARIDELRNASQDEIKQLLADFMTPHGGKSWDDLTINLHFDSENVVNIALPFTGDVEETVNEIAPETGAGVDYPFPPHYKFDPNVGATEAEKKANRLRSYQSRLGDYVMARCK